MRSNVCVSIGLFHIVHHGGKCMTQLAEYSVIDELITRMKHVATQCIVTCATI